MEAAAVAVGMSLLLANTTVGAASPLPYHGEDGLHVSKCEHPPCCLGYGCNYLVIERGHSCKELSALGCNCGGCCACSSTSTYWPWFHIALQRLTTQLHLPVWCLLAAS